MQGPDRGEVGSLHIGKIPSADVKKMCQALWETEAQVWLDKRLVVRHVKAHVAAGSSQQVDGERWKLNTEGTDTAGAVAKTRSGHGHGKASGMAGE